MSQVSKWSATLKVEGSIKNSVTVHLDYRIVEKSGNRKMEFLFLEIKDIL